ncbi:MAG: YggT family protein [Clostridia bacterium]|nr:YggT family protein [Clostridia bacterium]
METLAWIIYCILSVLDAILLISAIMSWIPEARESKLYELVEKILSPFLNPIRKLLERFEFVRRCPLDLSFLVLVIIVHVLSNLIWVIV